MISYLRGKIIYVSGLLKKGAYVIIDVEGVGYQAIILARHIGFFKKDSNAEMFVHHHIWQDGQELFGFLQMEEMQFFKLLIDVPGIGPRSALNILDKAEIKDIQNAVLSNSPDMLEKMSGIGKKTAEKIVLGLKESIQKISDGKKEEHYDSDAFDALISLGFTYDQARNVLSQVSKDLSVEKKVQEALRLLGKK